MEHHQANSESETIDCHTPSQPHAGAEPIPVLPAHHDNATDAPTASPPLENTGRDSTTNDADDAMDVDVLGEEDEDNWEPEGEVDDVMQAVDKIRGWEELRRQITADLKGNDRSLPLSKVDQLLILRNFATLRLKGFKKIAASEHIAQQWHDGEGKYFARQVRRLARHYQAFEQLPEGRKGGTKKARTLLLDEAVEAAARDRRRQGKSLHVSFNMLSMTRSFLNLALCRRSCSVNALHVVG